jgi:hypothetical protein
MNRVHYRKSPSPDCIQCRGNGLCRTGGEEPFTYDCECTVGEAIPVEALDAACERALAKEPRHTQALAQAVLLRLCKEIDQ